MEPQTITIEGREYVVIPRDEYDRVVSSSGHRPMTLPELPKRDPKTGRLDALAFGRALVARQIIERMNAAGLRQAALARQAGIAVETLNRILKCTRTPDESTVKKIEKALLAAEKP